MTRIDFHFNTPDKLAYCCRLVRKVYRMGQQVVVFDDQPSTLARLDQALWTFAPTEFIPHAAAGGPLATETPVLLAGEPVETPHHDVLINLSSEPPAFFSRFERLIELVDASEQDRGQARARWRFYKDRGYPIETHDLTVAKR